MAPTIPVVLLGWCITQVFFNALLAAQVAVLHDQVPTVQRGAVSGVLGVCVPVASVAGTYLVQAFDRNMTTMFLVPCAVGGACVLLFASRLRDRRLDPADGGLVAARAGRLLLRQPSALPGLRLGVRVAFLFVTAYAFLVTYQAYYLLDELGSAEDDVPRQIYLGTLVQSVAVVVASPIARQAVGPGRPTKIFVVAAVGGYGLALLLIAGANDLDGYLVGMAVGGVGFGMYMAVDLALVVDVLPDSESAAKDLGVLNIAGALPFALAPAVAPACSRWAMAATPSCTRWPRRAPSPAPWPSCRSGGALAPRGSIGHGRARLAGGTLPSAGVSRVGHRGSPVSLLAPGP